jgi:hypothetical protein
MCCHMLVPCRREEVGEDGVGHGGAGPCSSWEPAGHRRQHDQKGAEEEEREAGEHVLGVRVAVAASGGVGEDEPASGREDAAGAEEAAALGVVQGGSSSNGGRAGSCPDHLLRLVGLGHVSHGRLAALPALALRCVREDEQNRRFK